MRYCEYCATELPDHAAFCGHCGHAPTDPAEALTGLSEYPTAGLSNAPDTDDDEDEEEKRRRAAVIGLSLPVLADSMARAPGENVAMVQGTPEVGGVPSIQGTPQTEPTPDFTHLHHGSQPSVSPQHAVRLQDISSQSTRHLHTSQRTRPGAGGSIRVALVTFAAVTLIVASIIGAGFTILSPALSLSGSTNVTWGETIHLYGSHFIPGSSVVLTLDGTIPLYYTTVGPATRAETSSPTRPSTTPAPTGHLSTTRAETSSPTRPSTTPAPTGHLSMRMQTSNANIAAGFAGGDKLPHTTQHYTRPYVLSIDQIDTSTNSVVVSTNGTFNITINVSSDWHVGHHTIRAEEKITRRSAVLNFTIQQAVQESTSTPSPSPSATSSPTGTATPTGTPSPTATPSPLSSPTTSASGLSCVTPASIALAANQGSNQPNSKKITLCTSGSGLLTWTAIWDHNQAPWLQLDHSSGQIQAPGQGQVQVSAQASGLKPGKYTTTVTFSSQPGSSTVSLTVSFTVRTQCVSTTPGTLTFTGVVANSDPSEQTVKVRNCGSTAGNWSASSEANWLTVNPTNGTLSNGETQQVQIAVSLANLKIGTYNGDIVFTLGSSQSTVHVTLRVQAPTLSVQPSSINANNDCRTSTTFSAGGWVCHVTVTNTGNVQGNLNWSASSSGVAGITFTPASGTLAAGAPVQVTVNVPFNRCQTPTTLTFTGPANTVNIPWSCSNSTS